LAALLEGVGKGRIHDLDQLLVAGGSLQRHEQE